MIRRPPRSTLFPSRRSSDLCFPSATWRKGSSTRWSRRYRERRAGPGARIPGTATAARRRRGDRSEEHTSELQSRLHLVCRLLLEKKKKTDETVWIVSERYAT